MIKQILLQLDGVHRILTPHSVEKDLVVVNSSGDKFVIASICTSELNVYKLYFEKSAFEYIHKPLQRRFYSHLSVFITTKADKDVTIDR